MPRFHHLCSGNGFVIAKNETISALTNYYLSLGRGMGGGGRLTLQVCRHSGGPISWSVSRCVRPAHGGTEMDPLVLMEDFEWVSVNTQLNTNQNPSSAIDTLDGENFGALRITADPNTSNVVSIYANAG